MTLRILVTGGAGYIGSHMVKELAKCGYYPVTIDNLSEGHRDAVIAGEFFEGDLRNPHDLASVFNAYRVDAVMHFAANCYVGESVADPRKYYINNVIGTLNLLHAMLDAGVSRLVFSSSCATYGAPLQEMIDESHPQRPVNPYGETKLMVEHMLRDYAQAYGLRSVALRYFNAAGCDPDGILGERHDPETHLIPLVLREAKRVMAGGDPAATGLRVFGDDFDTPDGTCIRDYIHVSDLCSAHVAALRRLMAGAAVGAEAYNLGIGRGFSNKEVIEVCRKVTGVPFEYQMAGRRSGDPSRLVGDASKAREVLGWVPDYTDMEAIIATAWRMVGGHSSN